ncbi:DUF3426 domain-containing protein [Chitinibacter fontanus]|uniref:DUF3426 domain-containing protein n=1 Tax=Chitinibacter fontanus TaxID=1737446 RepID=A0A7D5ZHG2_9NEIS|nr:DUF3426 domain-containing protein [Chitinibacter fontanus]QLI80650.1 DUF3426 domain-containing protein [Chitinibacter fontanus]
MNQITRCPNCSTSFRVTDEQLAAHQGKVRCGRCSFIFNARDFLQRLEPAATAPSNTGGINPAEATEKAIKAIPSDKTPRTAENSTARVLDTSTRTETHISKEAVTSIAIEPAFPVNEPADKPDQSPAPAKDERDLQRALARLIKQTRRQKTRKSRKPNRHTIDASNAALSITDNTAAQNANSAAIDSEAEYRPILDDTDDLFLPPKRSRWSWLWSLGSLLLTMSLLAQLAYNYRLELSQEFPALRPKWLVLCSHLACEMPLPRQADLLRSEWSELTYIPDHPTLIQVKATLRNLAPFEQALPKLELTLTDESERVVAKKIFRPAEYLAQSDTVQNSLIANDELHAFLQLDLGTLNSTGYSLYWFYD